MMTRIKKGLYSSIRCKRGPKIVDIVSGPLLLLIDDYLTANACTTKALRSRANKQKYQLWYYVLCITTPSTISNVMYGVFRVVLNTINIICLAFVRQNVTERSARKPSLKID